MNAARESMDVQAEETRPKDRPACPPGPARTMTMMAAAFGLTRGKDREGADG